MAIEDNFPDVMLIEEALSEHRVDVDLRNFRDGEKAIQFIRILDSDDTLPCPALFLLDLNIPNRNGEEVLLEIRQSVRCAHTPVVVVTSSASPHDQEVTGRLGANYYFRKPADLDAFIELGKIVRSFIGG